LLAFAWTLLLSSIGYIIEHQSTYAEDQKEMEGYYVAYKNSLNEYNKIDSTFALWKNTIEKIDTIFRSMEYMNIKKAQDVTRDDILNYVGALADQRGVLSDIIIFISNAHYKNQSYTDISKDILSDAEYLDTFCKVRAEAIITFFKTGVKTEFHKTFEGLRRFREIDSRINEIETNLGTSVDDLNSLLRTAQSKENSVKFKKNLTIASGAYIGMFIGGWIGFLVWKKRIRPKPK
jgi:hypothetical protein